MRFAVLAALVVAAILALHGHMPLAHGAPPPDADPRLAPWFQGLQQPNGSSCCSIADCRPVDSRTKDGQYEALLSGGRWLPIPADKVIHPKSNPTGRAVLCSSPDAPDLVYCFAPPIEV